MIWWIWIAIGILCMILEITSLSFYFFSIGAGAIVTGLTASALKGLPVGFQIIVFCISTIISFLLMKAFEKKLQKPNNPESNIYALIGKTGKVTTIILPHKKGYVKIDGEEWSAIGLNPEETFTEGTIVTIEKTEGNKVIVSL
jgi:membrane protein implicated in regulation of membrane protease activity